MGSEGDGGGGSRAVWGKNVLSTKKSRFKGPEVRMLQAARRPACLEQGEKKSY